MSKNINKYLPKVLQPILEFQVLNASIDDELETIDRFIEDITKETIVNTATEYGVKRWENTLNIVAKDSDSLTTRKFRIRNILNNKLPYTIRWLQNKLTEITGSSTAWTISIDYNTYIVTVILAGLNTDWMADVQKQLRIALPANMVLEIGGEPISGSEILVGIATHTAYKLKFYS